jgi:hypothetical protein
MIILTLKIEIESSTINSIVKTTIANECNVIKDDIIFGDITQKTVCKDDGTIIKWEIKNEEINA